MKIQYTPESLNDLWRLRDFLEEKNSVVAKRVSQEIKNGIKKLKQFPKLGTMVDRAPDPEVMRDLYLGNYTVRYLIGPSQIIILRVWHGKEIGKDL